MPATARKLVVRKKAPGAARRARAKSPAPPEELEKLARAMVAAADRDPAEANRLQEKLVRAFYGDE